MTIHFVGGEIDDFDIASGVSHTTLAGFRSAYARCGIELSTSGFLVANFPTSTTVWLTWMFRQSSGSSLSTDFLRLRSAGLTRLRLRLVSGSNGPSLEKFDGTTGTLLATNMVSPPIGSLTRYDVAVDYSATGRFRLWQDGGLAIDYSGNLLAGGSTTLESVFFGLLSSSFVGQVSEVIIADEDTRSLTLKTLAPNAAGDTNGWTGSYADVDETTASELDIITANAAGLVTEMNVTGMPAGTTNAAVRLVSVHSSVGRGTAGPTGVQLGAKVGGASLYGPTQALDPSFKTVKQQFTTKPGGGAWTAADVEAMQIAMKAIA